MSAILDALKRQDAERKKQHEGPTAERRSVPRAMKEAPPTARPGRWLLALLGALGLGLVVFFRGQSAPEPGAEPPPARLPPPAAESMARSAPTPSPAGEPPAAGAPTVTEAALAARVEKWRISAHIYGAARADRALWVDGKAYGEGEVIEGLTLEAITLEGFRVRVEDVTFTRRITPP